MEFKFRAGEDRSSYAEPSPADGYFTAQALRAGYFGADLRRPEPLQNAGVPAREALLREVEKERIREEIIAREILQKRELEEEVRRELAYEREMAMRSHANRFSLSGPASVPSSLLLPEPQRAMLPPPPPPSAQGVRMVERFSVSSQRDFGLVDRLPIPRLPFQRLLEPRANEIGRVPEVGTTVKVEALGNTTSSPNFASNKRKAAVEAAEYTSPKKVKKEWSCALCQVSTTSEQGLNEHLQGKKHKTKEEELIAGKPGGNEKNAFRLISKKANKSNFEKQGVTANGQQKSQSQVGKTEQQQVLKKENGIVSKPPLVCEHCQVKCNSESMLSSHLSGKKHLARMQELERGKAPMTKGSGESRADKKVVRVVKMKQKKQGKGEAASSENPAGLLSMDGMAKTKDELAKEEHLKANKTSGNSKGPYLKKNGKSMLVKKVIPSKEQQKPQVGLSKQQKPQVGQSKQQKPQVGQSKQQHVLKRPNGALKKHPFRCEHCKAKCNSERMLECHLRGKRHLIRMQELENGMAVPVNHAGVEGGKVDAAVSDGNEKSKADGNVGKVVEANQSSGKQEGVSSIGVSSIEKLAQRMDAPSDATGKAVTAEEETSCRMEVEEENK